MITYEDWTGLCQKCSHQRGNPHKLSHDEYLKSGSIIHWGERDPNNPMRRIAITCGLCGEKRMTTRPPSQRAVDKNSTGYCRKHFDDLASIRPLIIEAVRKRPRGRQLGDKIIDNAQAVSDIDNFIMEVWREVKLPDSVTLSAVASKFHLRGERIGSKGVKKRLERAGINETWEEYRQSVIDKRREL